MGRKHMSVTVERARKEITAGNRDRVQRTVCRSTEDVVNIWCHGMKVKITEYLEADAATTMERIYVLKHGYSEVMGTLNCEELAIFNYGLILHEMFHLFYTPSIESIKLVIGSIKNRLTHANKRFPNLCHYADRLDHRFLFQFVNVIEDAHIERRGKLNFPKFIMPIDFMNMVYRRFSKSIRDESGPVRMNPFAAVMNFTLQFAVMGKKPDLDGIDEELAKTLVSAKRLILEAVYENEGCERTLKALDVLDAIVDQIVSDDEVQDKTDSLSAGIAQENNQNSSSHASPKKRPSEGNVPSQKIQKPKQKKPQKLKEQQSEQPSEDSQQEKQPDASQSVQSQENTGEEQEDKTSGSDSKDSGDGQAQEESSNSSSDQDADGDSDEEDDSESDNETGTSEQSDSGDEDEDDIDDDSNDESDGGSEDDDFDDESEDDEFEEESEDDDIDNDAEDYDSEDESEKESETDDDGFAFVDEDKEKDNSESDEADQGGVSDEEKEDEDPDPEQVKEFMDNLVRTIQQDLLNEETEGEESRSLLNSLKNEAMPNTEFTREYGGHNPPLRIKKASEEPLPKELKRLVNGYVTRLCRKVEEEVKTRTEGGVLPYQFTGRFNSGRIMDHVMKNGADKYRLFDQEIEGEEGLDICVEILIDESGSMSSNRENTLVIADILYETCVNLRIPVRVATFKEQTYLLCDFDEPCKVSFERRLAAYKPDDGTNEAQALLILERSLLRRPEKNKYLFLITDGAPGFYCYDIDSMTWLNQYQRYMIKKGVQMVACCTGSCAERVAKIYDGPKIVYNDYPKLVKRLTDEFLRPLKT